jgi:hypothetical protein
MLIYSHFIYCPFDFLPIKYTEPLGVERLFNAGEFYPERRW